MIKLIFSLVIIISATLIGNSFSVKLSNRRKTLTSIVAAISRMKTLICFGGYETERVVQNCLCTDEFPLINMDSDTTLQGFDQAFESGVHSIGKSFGLNSSDKELLISFGSQLGSTDTSGQVAHAELYTELFSERLNFAKEQENQKCKLYRILGFALGCAISLMIV